MHISFDKAVDCFIAFMSEQVAKISKDWPKWLSYGALAAVKFNPSPLKNAVKPWLEMSGILKDNMVDIDMMKAALENAFRNVPEIEYFNFRFNAEDAAGFIAKMQGVASAETKPREIAESTEVEE